MSQAHFVHPAGYAAPDDAPHGPAGGARHAANDAAGLPLVLSVFADRAHLRGEMRDDALAAGFRMGQDAGLDRLLDDDSRVAGPLGDVVLVDCPIVDLATIPALARLDMRAAHCGASLVVSTTLGALDDVFACMDQSGPQILVDPTRGDRVIALGRVLARVSALQVRELAEEDRLMLLRLTEQVSGIAQRLERLGSAAADPAPAIAGEESAFAFEAPRRAFRITGDDGLAPAFAPAAGAPSAGDRLVRSIRPPLPDPRLVRRIIRQRQLRARFLDGELFADPAWDMRSNIFEKSNDFKAAA